MERGFMVHLFVILVIHKAWPLREIQHFSVLDIKESRNSFLIRSP